MLYVKDTKEKGFAALLTTILVLIFMLSLAMSMSVLIFDRQKISTNTIASAQSYYAAESGAEDALLRLKNNPNMASSSYSLNVANAVSTITIADFIGSSRIISTQSNNANIIKNLSVTYNLDTTGAGFHYAVQAGGGFSLGSGSEVVGNIFANGNVTDPTASATVDNDVVVVGTHTISGHNNGNKLIIGGNATAYGCSFAAVTGSLTITGGSNSCGSASSGSQVQNQPLPISQSQIDSWENSASSLCNSTDVTNLAGNNKSVSLGSCKVTGDLIVGNGSTLTMTGNIYVTGNITFNNKATLLLSSSLGASSVVLITGTAGTITVSNSVTVKSLGQAGSNIILLSTSSSSSAINIQNGGTIDGATLYASAGGIQLNNNAHLHQITAAGTITLGNGIKLVYDVGLAYNSFNSGPGGSWKVTSWQEQ